MCGRCECFSVWVWVCVCIFLAHKLVESLFVRVGGVATISRLLKITGRFAEYSLFCRALLQKRPILLSSLLIVGTPYLHFGRDIETKEPLNIGHFCGK